MKSTNEIDKKIDEQLQMAATGIPINFDPSAWQKLSVMLDNAPVNTVKKSRNFHLNLILLLILSGVISAAVIMRSETVSPILEKEKKSTETITIEKQILVESNRKLQSEKLRALINANAVIENKSDKKLNVRSALPTEEIKPSTAAIDSITKKENLFIFW